VALSCGQRSETCVSVEGCVSLDCLTDYEIFGRVRYYLFIIRKNINLLIFRATIIFLFIPVIISSQDGVIIL